jgi:2-dehydropantoate 2-reductase
MLYALERGRPPEIDFLNGEVVRRAERHGQAAPVNAALVAQVRAVFDGTRKPGITTLREVYDRTRAA